MVFLMLIAAAWLISLLFYGRLWDRAGISVE
jgi:hypothetical protein